MELNLHNLRGLLRSRGLKPKDYLGQNFLIDQDALEAVVEAGEVTKKDVVLEVGPGLGTLTRLLSEKAKQVIAIEKDGKLIPVLKQELAGINNIQLIHDDALKYDFSKNLTMPFKVVANIPYYLTSKFIGNLLSLKNKPKLIVLMIQKEVGERIVAKAGELSILGISVQVFSDPEIVAQVPRQNFWPVPKVDSVIIRIEPRHKYSDIDEKLFFRLLKIAFAGKRKQLHNSLVNGLHWPKERVMELLKDARISHDSRPQDLALEDWVRLQKVFAER